MHAIKAKAELISADMTQQPHNSKSKDAINWVTVIIQIISTVLGAGGLGLCPTPTPAQVKNIMNNPDGRHRRVLRRTIRHHVGNPATQEIMEHSFYNVGQNVTDDEAMQMYKEANGL